MRIRLACLWLISGALAVAQDIRIYSEFERFDPWGNPVAADRDISPREILSPAMPRNGHLSVHVIVTGPKGLNYFIYLAANPQDIVDLKLYREHFRPCGTGLCPDWLAEQKTPSFGAIPESLYELPDQTTRCYLLDIKARADTPPRRVRVEALLKAGTWVVAPMEVRIVSATIPDVAVDTTQNTAPVDAPSSITAQFQLLRFLSGLPPQRPETILTVRDVIQRNAAEDMMLARSYGRSFPELNLMAWWPAVYPLLGAEWYLKVRDLLYRLEH